MIKYDYLKIFLVGFITNSMVLMFSNHVRWMLFYIIKVIKNTNNEILYAKNRYQGLGRMRIEKF